MTKPMPERASVVVIGGGVIGTSIAYHLASSGVSDVVLVERDELASLIEQQDNGADISKLQH